MDLNQLTAISPIDGRYRNKTEDLAQYFSEFGLIKYRVFVEIEYFIALCQHPLPELKNFDQANYEKLRAIYSNFSTTDAQRIKDIEKETNHDVKAVEYYLKEKFSELNLSQYKEFIHFALTSQDINNTATPLSLKEATQGQFLPNLIQLKDKLTELAESWEEIPMLSRTHGQPASPTRLGKEMNVFIARLEEQIKQFKAIPFSAKFGGATGNFNAHHAAYPEIDWNMFADNFVNNILGLKRSKPTTQIEHYDNIAAYFHALSRINTILTDMAKDIWSYISFNYFKQKIKKGEVGSSAMPHKVNPIDFENAEGNLGLSTAVGNHMSTKLPISRLQRDLTDSTVLRNIGIPIAYTNIAISSLIKGLGKISPNQEVINKDLENNWIVVAEAIQTILRKEGYENPYELLKELTRTGEKITQEKFNKFIDNLNINENIKTKLKSITPFNYTGL
ncbi:MAG: adenylosuccinate lyase [Bacteroidales bacterium]